MSAASTACQQLVKSSWAHKKKWVMHAIYYIHYYIHTCMLHVEQTTKLFYDILWTKKIYGYFRYKNILKVTKAMKWRQTWWIIDGSFPKIFETPPWHRQCPLQKVLSLLAFLLQMYSNWRSFTITKVQILTQKGTDRLSKDISKIQIFARKCNIPSESAD
jgi:hypothetical protein